MGRGAGLSAVWRNVWLIKAYFPRREGEEFHRKAPSNHLCLNVATLRLCKCKMKTVPRAPHLWVQV